MGKPRNVTGAGPLQDCISSSTSFLSVPRFISTRPFYWWSFVSIDHSCPFTLLIAIFDTNWSYLDVFVVTLRWRCRILLETLEIGLSFISKTFIDLLSRSQLELFGGEWIYFHIISYAATESLSMNATLSLAFKIIAFNFEHDHLKLNFSFCHIFLRICFLEKSF